MSALFTRLAELHTTGHARDDLDMLVESRITPDTSKEFRAAAVLAAVTERESPGLLLIHRPSHMRAHPGQIALPGGKLDPGEDAVQAALREANEELGIDPDDVRVVGASDSYRTWSGFDITPVIAMIPPNLELNPNPNEVAQWFETPLDYVLDPANQQEIPMEFQGKSYLTWQINWQEHRIWGVTASLLVNLSRRLGYHG